VRRGEEIWPAINKEAGSALLVGRGIADRGVQRKEEINL
jgi:hypothetical protein